MAGSRSSARNSGKRKANNGKAEPRDLAREAAAEWGLALRYASSALKPAVDRGAEALKTLADRVVQGSPFEDGEPDAEAGTHAEEQADGEEPSARDEAEAPDEAPEQDEEQEPENADAPEEGPHDVSGDYENAYTEELEHYEHHDAYATTRS